MKRRDQGIKIACELDCACPEDDAVTDMLCAALYDLARRGELKRVRVARNGVAVIR